MDDFNFFLTDYDNHQKLNTQRVVNVNIYNIPNVNQYELDEQVKFTVTLSEPFARRMSPVYLPPQDKVIEVLKCFRKVEGNEDAIKKMLERLIKEQIHNRILTILLRLQNGLKNVYGENVSWYIPKLMITNVVENIPFSIYKPFLLPESTSFEFDFKKERDINDLVHRGLVGLNLEVFHHHYHSHPSDTISSMFSRTRKFMRFLDVSQPLPHDLYYHNVMNFPHPHGFMFSKYDAELAIKMSILKTINGSTDRFNELYFTSTGRCVTNSQILLVMAPHRSQISDSVHLFEDQYDNFIDVLTSVWKETPAVKDREISYYDNAPVEDGYRLKKHLFTLYHEPPSIDGQNNLPMTTAVESGCRRYEQIYYRENPIVESESLSFLGKTNYTVYPAITPNFPFTLDDPGIPRVVSTMYLSDVLEEKGEPFECYIPQDVFLTNETCSMTYFVDNIDKSFSSNDYFKEADPITGMLSVLYFSIGCTQTHADVEFMVKFLDPKKFQKFKLAFNLTFTKYQTTRLNSSGLKLFHMVWMLIINSTLRYTLVEGDDPEVSGQSIVFLGTIAEPMIEVFRAGGFVTSGYGMSAEAPHRTNTLKEMRPAYPSIIMSDIDATSITEDEFISLVSTYAGLYPTKPIALKLHKSSRLLVNFIHGDVKLFPNYYVIQTAYSHNINERFLVLNDPTCPGRYPESKIFNVFRNSGMTKSMLEYQQNIGVIPFHATNLKFTGMPEDIRRLAALCKDSYVKRTRINSDVLSMSGLITYQSLTNSSYGTSISEVMDLKKNFNAKLPEMKLSPLGLHSALIDCVFSKYLRSVVHQDQPEVITVMIDVGGYCQHALPNHLRGIPDQYYSSNVVTAAYPDQSLLDGIDINLSLADNIKNHINAYTADYVVRDKFTYHFVFMLKDVIFALDKAPAERKNAYLKEIYEMSTHFMDWSNDKLNDGIEITIIANWFHCPTDKYIPNTSSRSAYITNSIGVNNTIRINRFPNENVLLELPGNVRMSNFDVADLVAQMIENGEYIRKEEYYKDALLIAFTAIGAITFFVGID